MGLGRMLDLLLLAGEAGWIYAWTVTAGAWIGGTRAPLLNLALVLALLAASTSLARFAAGSRDRRWLPGAIVLLGILAALAPALAALNLPIDAGWDVRAWNDGLEGEALARAVLTGGGAAIVWQRGLSAGRATPDLVTVEGSFRTGVIAMASLLAYVGLAGSAAPLASDALIPSTMVVLLSGLVAMPLARIAEVSERPRHQAGPGLLPGGPWLAMLLAIVAAILGVTLILARLFTFERIGAVLDAVGSAVDDVLMSAIYVLAIPFGLLVEALVFLARIMIKPGPQQQRPEQADTDWMPRLQEQGEVGQTSPELLFALKVGLVVALAAILIWILWRAISRLGRLWHEDEVEESRDSVWVWPGWVAAWCWLLGRLRPVRARASAVLAPRRRERGPAEQSVRGLYGEFLRLGALIGHSRQSPETPLEYEERLGRIAPEGAAEVRTLSDAYIRARYAPPSSREPDLRSLSAALSRLRVRWEGRVVMGKGEGGRKTGRSG